MATELQLVPPLVLASQLMLPVPAPVNTTLPFDPAHTVELPVLNAAEAGA